MAKKVKLKIVKRESADDKTAREFGTRIAKASAKATTSEVELSKLYQDPNNPRLPATSKVKKVTDPAVQILLDDIMEKSNGRAFKTYYDKMRHEGFVKSFGSLHVAEIKGGLLLCDGNTRVAVMRKLVGDHDSGKIKLSADVLASFDEIPVINLGKYGTADTMLAWNSVRVNAHILPPKAWGPLNKAEYIYHLKNSVKLTVTEIQTMVGVRSNTVQENLEAYRLYHSIKKDPKYGVNLKPARFSICMEIIRKKMLRTYLKWDGRKANPKRLEVLCKLIQDKGYLTGGGQLERIRSLGSDVNAWHRALKPKDNAQYLDALKRASKGKDLNEISVEFATALKNATVEETMLVDNMSLREIVGLCNGLLKNRRKLVA